MPVERVRWCTHLGPTPTLKRTVDSNRVSHDTARRNLIVVCKELDPSKRVLDQVCETSKAMKFVAQSPRTRPESSTERSHKENVEQRSRNEEDKACASVFSPWEVLAIHQRLRNRYRVDQKVPSRLSRRRHRAVPQLQRLHAEETSGVLERNDQGNDQVEGERDLRPISDRLSLAGRAAEFQLLKVLRGRGIRRHRGVRVAGRIRHVVGRGLTCSSSKAYGHDGKRSIDDSAGCDRGSINGRLGIDRALLIAAPPPLLRPARRQARYTFSLQCCCLPCTLQPVLLVNLPFARE